MKAVLALLVGVAYSASVWQDDIVDFSSIDVAAAFEDWMVAFDKTYTDADEKGHRYLIFLENWKECNDHNKYAHATWTKGVNQFSDLTQKEFEDRILCRIPERTTAGSIWGEDMVEMPPLHTFPAAPTSIDWTHMNGSDYTNPIKDQGSCGSCWAFGTTGSLEPRVAIAKGLSAKVNLAEQELVDCDKHDHGCNGGLPQNAYKYIGEAKGLCLTSSYHYTAKNGACKASSCGTHYDAVKASGSSTHVTTDSAAALETATAAGPVALGVDASNWHNYKSGVFSGTCGTNLNHAVTSVGYGTTTGGDYWKVRNSWGPSWGMNGYILVCRNCNKNGAKGECGINHDNCYPNLA